MLLKVSKKSKQIFSNTKLFYSKESFKIEDLTDLFDDDNLKALSEKSKKHRAEAEKIQQFKKEETENEGIEEGQEIRDEDAFDEEIKEELTEEEQEEFYQMFYPKRTETEENLKGEIWDELKDEDGFLPEETKLINQTVQKLTEKLSEDQMERINHSLEGNLNILDEHGELLPERNPYVPTYEEIYQKTVETLTSAISIIQPSEKTPRHPISSLKDNTKTVHIFDKLYKDHAMSLERKERIKGNKTVDMLNEIVGNRKDAYHFATGLDDIGVEVIVHRNILRHFSGIKFFRRGKCPHVVLSSSIRTAFNKNVTHDPIPSPDEESEYDEGYEGYEGYEDSEFERDYLTGGVRLLEYQREMDKVENYLDMQSHNPLTKSQKRKRRERTNKRRIFHKRLEGTLQVIMYMRKK